MKKLFFCFLLILSYTINLTTLAEVRFVSKTGSSTPPYTNWQTAADSIQKCINISSFGDTIYVANGRYKEQIISKRGLTFIGGGMDSCIIDAKELAELGFTAVELKDSCIFKNFKVEVSRDFGIYYGFGVASHGIERKFVTIEFNNIVMASRGISINMSDGNIRHNIISDVHHGIDTEATNSEYYPFIDTNYISAKESCIWINFGMSPTIRGNILNVTRTLGQGFRSIVPGKTLFTNNIIRTLGVKGKEGVMLWPVPNMIKNSVVLGNFEKGILADKGDTLINNSVTGCDIGIERWDISETPLIKYNNSWNNNYNYNNVTHDPTNISYDPMYVNEDSLDLHLQLFSALIDAGDPSILDVDGSRSDIGVFGGPYGESYTYLDLAPKSPKNLNAFLDSGVVKLTWNQNTESDFKFYKIYRDTVSNFLIDSTKLIAETSDALFSEPLNTTNDLYYKVTAVDQTNNESVPSEEAAVILTNVKVPEVKMRDYLLYSNYPNPFNPSTVISYQIRKSGYVRLVVYDIQGEIVKELENSWKTPGYYKYTFNSNNIENQLSSGIYLYKLEVKNDRNLPVHLEMKKMILLK